MGLEGSVKKLAIFSLILFILFFPSIVSPVKALMSTKSQSQVESVLSSRNPETYVPTLSQGSTSQTGLSRGADPFLQLIATLSSPGALSSAAGQLVGSPILNHVPLTVNVVFAGVPSQVADQNLFLRDLPSSYSQVDETHRGLGLFAPLVQYDITYNFVTATQSFTSNYVNYLISSSHSQPAPYWLQNTNKTRIVYMTSAFNAENYLWTNLASQYNGFSVVLLNPSAFPALHFYNGTVADPDTGMISDTTSAQYMVAFGGEHRMMFVDFDAGPEHYTTLQSAGQSPALKPLWSLDLTTLTGLSTAQTEMIASVRLAVEGRFVNSFLYTPLYHPAILFNVTIYSMDTSVRWSSLLNTGLIQTAFSELDPMSTILPPQVSEIPGQSDGAFYSVLQSSYYTVTTNGTTVALYNNSILTDYFTHHLSRYASTSLTLPSGSPVSVIPIVVVAGLENIDDLVSGTLGSALAGPDGNFGLIELMISPSWVNLGFGLSHLIIHESGHALGLTHPHNIYDNQVGPVTFWLEDFSFTPMSYCCSYTHYDSLAKDNLNQGLTATLLNKTLVLTKLGEQIYNTLGYGELPPSAMTEANMALTDIGSVQSSFRATNPDYAAATSNALDAVHHIENGIKMLRDDLMSITYVVDDGQGQPLVNADVQVILPNGTKIEGHTGSAGTFALNALPWGNYTYAVKFEGTTVGNAFLKEEGQKSRTLQAGVSQLSFLVTDRDGHPLSGAGIMILAPNGTTLSLVTDRFGKTNLGLSADGNYDVVKINWQGIEVTPSGPVSTNLSRSGTTSVKARVYNLSVKVSDLLGLSISGVTITLTHPNGTVLTATTNGDGAAIFPDLPYGDYSGSASYLGQTASLQVSGTGVPSGSSAIRLAFSPISISIFTLIPGAAIGAGVLLVRRRYRAGPKQGTIEQPAYIPSPATQTQPEYPPQQQWRSQAPVSQPAPGPVQYPPQLQPVRGEPSLPVGIQPAPPGRIIPAETVQQPAQPAAQQVQQPTSQTPPPSVELRPAVSPSRLQFCPMCGTKTYQGAKFCHSCGKQF